MKQRNEEAQADEQTLRISLDAKAAVKVGPFARGGKSRVRTSAADHDFEAIATVTPVGIFLPTSDELFLYGVTSKVTSDCLVDRLGDWWETVKERFPRVKTLLINLDNGPESHSRRTQFKHWNGALLDSLEAVIQYATSMTWKGTHPMVTLVTTTYRNGVKLTKEAMQVVETQLQRLPSLGKWFIDIGDPLPAIRDS